MDTGSEWSGKEWDLEALRGSDLEVHYVRAHGYLHSSAPVTTAMDLAFALCRTKYLFATHSDVFPRRRDFLAWMLGQTDEKVPVAGWEMSPRKNTDLWRGTVSHTATMFHMPTMRKIGATWSLERWYERNGFPPLPTTGWPDTESTLRDCLVAASITPKLLGPEPNFERHKTEWFDHARSVVGSNLYASEEQRAKTQSYAREALSEAKTRLQEWAPSIPSTSPPV